MDSVLYYGSSTQIHSGACQWMFRLADGMREYGFETTAVLPSDEGIAEWYHDAGVDVAYEWSEPIRRGSPSHQLRYLLAALAATVRLLWRIRSEDIDIVHVNEIRHAPGLLAGWASGAKTVCHVRACFEDRRLRRLFGAMVSFFADEVVCVSDRTAELMFDSVGHGGDHVRVLHDGAPSPERFETLPTDEAFRAEFDIPSETPLVVCVSKLTHNKGQDRLVDAAAALRDEEVAFAIVGGTVDGHTDYADELEARISELPNTRLTGFYTDLPAVLGAADLLVHVPRHEDPFPGVVLEGMLAGLPVIGSKSGGIPEQIDHGETGYIVPKDEPTPELTDRIRTLTDDEERRAQMGRAGRRRVLNEFDETAYYRSVADLYRSLLTSER